MFRVLLRFDVRSPFPRTIVYVRDDILKSGHKLFINRVYNVSRICGFRGYGGVVDLVNVFPFDVR